MNLHHHYKHMHACALHMSGVVKKFVHPLNSPPLHPYIWNPQTTIATLLKG